MYENVHVMTLYTSLVLVKCLLLEPCAFIEQLNAYCLDKICFVLFASTIIKIDFDTLQMFRCTGDAADYTAYAMRNNKSQLRRNNNEINHCFNDILME